jgi:hypothetical protein
MTSAHRVSFPRCLPLIGLLAQLSAAEPVTLPLPRGSQPRIEAPGLELDRSGALVAPRGFVLRLDDRVLLGDALRFHQKDDDLYATGRVVLVMPGVRLHADRLGLHPQAQSGEAWGVEAFIDHADRRIVITADHVFLDRSVLRFDGVRAIAGHGGLVGLGATSARVYLRDQPADDRSGFERQVEGIELVGTTIRAGGVPVMWLPYLYRDFSFDYPWTRFEGGHQRRLGNYVRGWVGSGLRDILGWHPRIEARGDLYSRTGEAWGVHGAWRHGQHGTGEITWFEAPDEIVMGGDDGRQNVVERRSSVFDAEQQLHGFGGALYGRWVSLPDADPPMPGDPPQPWDERFRADYLRDDLEHRPFARRGVAATWGTALGSITLDTERRAHPDQPTSDRLWGVQVVMPRLRVAGPLHLGGAGWSESLENTVTDDAAVRTSYDATASAMQWFGPLGIDLGGGVQGLVYQDARLAGLEVDDQARMVPVVTAGVRTRVVGDLGGGISHIFTPRVGVELYQEGRGDVLSPWAFGDPRDRLEEDRQLLTAGFDTSLAGERTLFRASAVARWGLRAEDRLFTDDAGVVGPARSSLVDVAGTVEGAPIASVLLTGTAVYDAQLERMRSFDLGSSWVTSRWTALRYSGSLIPETATTAAEWQHRPGLTAMANRYRFDGDVTLRPGGDPLDQWLVQLTRRMVDGDLSLTYELVRDLDGAIYDRRFGIGFSMSVGGTGDRPAGIQAPSGQRPR